jgi:hypothetical protein
LGRRFCLPWDSARGALKNARPSGPQVKTSLRETLHARTISAGGLLVRVRGREPRDGVAIAAAL